MTALSAQQVTVVQGKNRLAQTPSPFALGPEESSQPTAGVPNLLKASKELGQRKSCLIRASTVHSHHSSLIPARHGSQNLDEEITPVRKAKSVTFQSDELPGRTLSSSSLSSLEPKYASPEEEDNCWDNSWDNSCCSELASYDYSTPQASSANLVEAVSIWPREIKGSLQREDLGFWADVGFVTHEPPVPEGRPGCKYVVEPLASTVTIQAGFHIQPKAVDNSMLPWDA